MAIANVASDAVVRILTKWGGVARLYWPQEGRAFAELEVAREDEASEVLAAMDEAAGLSEIKNIKYVATFFYNNRHALTFSRCVKTRGRA